MNNNYRVLRVANKTCYSYLVNRVFRRIFYKLFQIFILFIAFAKFEEKKYHYNNKSS